MKPKVYIESTIPSYYIAKPSRDLIVAAHQQLTKTWWDIILPKIDPFISPFVLEEIARGDKNAAKLRLKAVGSFPVLDVTPEAEDLAEFYFKKTGIPEKARTDSYHLALATCHQMDFIVTWNCTHIASGPVKKIIEKINLQKELWNPMICTPEELMEV